MDHPAEPRSPRGVWNHGLTLNPNLLQGRQTLTGTSAIVKLDWGFYWVPE